MAFRDNRDRDRRRELDRPDDKRRPDDRDRRDRDALPAQPTRGGGLNEFFVDGEGIHREVMQREICKYLGPEAYCRPGVYNVCCLTTVRKTCPH